MPVEIIILAAGQGKRMQSDLPKVLHSVGGKPMLQHLLETASKLKPKRIHVVVGHAKKQVISTIEKCMPALASGNLINWVEQKKQLGTGHAVKQALPAIKENPSVLILNGDCPLISVKTLRRITRLKQGKQLNLLTVTLDDPTGMGRIVRDQKNKITGIVEEKDTDAQQKKIRETNTNCLCVNRENLWNWLSSVNRKNAQKEYYLTDVIASSVKDGATVKSINPDVHTETLGVNNKTDLSRLERIYQLNNAEMLMNQGVTLLDPHRFDLRGTCKFGNDCVVDINVILQGHVRVGNAVTISPNSIIKDAVIGDGCVIEANSVIENAKIGKGCSIGPFARIRPETELKNDVRIGNFVEIKKSVIKEQSKVNHLSYVGDSKVGRNVNIGAGVITCNYDGANKHQTHIGDDVFVGSDSQLVAPVKIDDGATIGAGSTITDDVKSNALAVSRSRQRAVNNWKRPKKN